MTMSLNVGTGGVPMWIPGNSLANEPNDKVLNKPLLEVEQAVTVGDANDIMLIDPTQYMLARKGGARVDLSMHVMFIYGEWVLRFMFRLDGNTWWSSAITPANDGDTLGPFIGLAERT
jgi:HK97 family phage major capsid protein